jgi:hypothetical protein
LGFTTCFHSKLTRNLNPMYLDEGGITYLHTAKAHVGTLVFARLKVPAPINAIRETTVVGMTAAFETGSLSFTNSRNRFDPLSGREAVLVKADDPAVIYDRFVSYLSRRPQPPRVFAGCDAVRQWLDECRLESFEARVARGLFVRMTDEEVAQARQMMGNGSPP